MKLRLVSLATLAVWIAAVAGALAWLLPLAGAPSAVPAQAVMATTQPPAGAGGAERLLGMPPPAELAAPPAVPEESRFKLVGVIAPRRPGGAGLALISVDGQPARAVAVGREVDAGMRVLAIAHRRVELGPKAGPPAATLELPPMPEPNRGVPGSVADGMPQVGMPGAAGPTPGGRLPMTMPGVAGPVPMPGVAAPGAVPGTPAYAARQRPATAFAPGSPSAGGTMVSPAVTYPSPMPGVQAEPQVDTVASPGEGRAAQ